MNAHDTKRRRHTSDFIPFSTSPHPYLATIRPQSTKATAAAARAAPPRDPATWLAPPVKWVGVGVPVLTPLVPFIATLLTMRDGQGDVSIGGALRVIILSGAGEGQDVPQGARTVERDWTPVNLCFKNPSILGRAEKVHLPARWRRWPRWQEQQGRTSSCLWIIFKGEQSSDSVGRKSVGLTERIKD